MDFLNFMKLTNTEAGQALTFYGYPEAINYDYTKKLEMLEDIWNQRDQFPSHPEVIVDLYIASAFQGNIPQQYDEQSIRSSPASTLQGFANVFGLNVSEPHFMERLLRILDFLEVLTTSQPSDVSQMSLEDLVYRCYTEGCEDELLFDYYEKSTGKALKLLPGYSTLESLLYGMYLEEELNSGITYKNNQHNVLGLMAEYGMENLIRKKVDKKIIQDLQLGPIFDGVLLNGHLGILKYLKTLMKDIGVYPFQMIEVAGNGHLDMLKYLFGLKDWKRIVFTDQKYFPLPAILKVDLPRSRDIFKKPLQPVLDWLISKNLLTMNQASIDEAQRMGLDTSRMVANR